MNWLHNGFGIQKHNVESKPDDKKHKHDDIHPLENIGVLDKLLYFYFKIYHCFDIFDLLCKQFKLIK